MDNRRSCDLHLHTHWSDGTLSVADTARRARDAGLAAIAITDHDTIGPELSRAVDDMSEVEVICGVELKAEVCGHRGEILGYFLQPDHPALRELFTWMGRARRARMREMIQRCRELLGIPLEYEEVAARTGGSVGRPHLAAELVRRGAAGSPQEAFDRFLGRDGACYVPLPRPSSRQVLAAIRAAGGVGALAHPGLLPLEDWRSSLARLKEEGMAALEVHYPYTEVRGPVYIRPPQLAALAGELGLVATGGSDDHGPNSVRDSLGMIRVPYAAVAALRPLASSVT
ncbi:MAG: PHP domain-containing protein [Candidatus Bipolaricaulaceae bacterium]